MPRVREAQPLKTEHSEPRHPGVPPDVLAELGSQECAAAVTEEDVSGIGFRV